MVNCWRHILLASLLLLTGSVVTGQSSGLPYNWKPRKPAYDSFWRADTTKNQRRVRTVTGICLGGYTAAYAGIGAAWYRDYPRTDWHWFNDNHEWAQIDKMGHFVGGYQGSRGMIGLFKWSGLPKWKAATYGSLIGFMSLAPIEVFDGFADKWGASWGDLVADFGGAALAFGNEMLWAEQRIMAKVSYHPTPYATARPDLFGDRYSKYLKDYNGHTGWLSFRVHSFLPEGNFKKRYPRWLNVAVGYGANGLLGGYDNGLTPAIRAREYRQYYLTFDIDLSAIPTRHGGLRFVLDVLNFIHLPAPAMEYSSKYGFRFYGLYM